MHQSGRRSLIPLVDNPSCHQVSATIGKPKQTNAIQSYEVRCGMPTSSGVASLAPATEEESRPPEAEASDGVEPPNMTSSLSVWDTPGAAEPEGFGQTVEC